jgi:nucleoside-triphosphatase
MTGPKKHIFITGKPGIGKSTIIRKVLQSSQWAIGGFVTEEIREAGARVGFTIEDIETGAKKVMAHVRLQSRFRVGRYGVDAAAVESVGVPAVARALRESALVVVDEIGKMELYSEEFSRWVGRLVEADKPVLAVIQERRKDLLALLAAREDSEVITLTEQNRDGLPGIILQKLQAVIDPEEEQS